MYGYSRNGCGFFHLTSAQIYDDRSLQTMMEQHRGQPHRKLERKNAQRRICDAKYDVYFFLSTTLTFDTLQHTTELPAAGVNVDPVN